MSATVVAQPARRLPFTLLVLAGIMAFKASILVAVSAGATLETLRPILGFTTGPELTSLIRETPGASFFLLVVAGVLLVSAVGMLSGRRLGWLLAMVITGLSVALDIYGFVTGTANHMWSVLNIVTVFYLNQRDVREAVGAAEPIEADQDALAT